MTKNKINSKERKSIVRSAFFWIFWIYCGLFGLSIYLSWHISLGLSVANYIPKDTASNVLKALLEAEIALVGFWGIILVYVFNNLRGAKERVSADKHELEVKGYVKAVTDELEPLWEKYKTRVDELDREFRQLVVQTFVTGISSVATVVLLFLCILQTISSMGMITDNGLHYWNLFLCLFPLFMTFVFIFAIIIRPQSKREFDILKQELRKKWERQRLEGK